MTLFPRKSFEVRPSRVAASRLAALFIGFVFLSLTAPGRAQVLITEFMAANVKSLADEDRQYPDWIELYNAGTNTVNLDGWHLTDKADRPTRWTFPATELAPNSYLVVFASQKDRRVPGRPLHTNFKLKSDGGYLALIRPDGRTVASEFSPYPPQVPGVSCGWSMRDRVTPLVTDGAVKKILVATADPDPGWLNPKFNDTRWLATTNGVGFSTNTDYTGLIGADLRRQMFGKPSSVLVRVPFEVEDPRAMTLKLQMRCDAGFIAYLNGTEIARRNAPAQTQWNSPATARRGLGAPTLLEEGFEGDGSRYTLAELSPVTRSRVNQGIAGATGGCLRLVNGRIDNQANSVAFPRTAPGLFESVQAHFDYRFKSLQNGPTTLAFMLVPVATYGANGAGVPVETFRDLHEPLLPGVFAVGLELHPDPMQNVISIYWNGKKTMSSRLAPGGAGLLARTFDRLQIRLNHVKDGATVSVGFVADASGVGRRFQPVKNVFVPGLNPFEHRAQIAARISNWDTTIDLDNIKVQQIPASGLMDEEFDVSAQLGALHRGHNVLAIQGLRAGVSDEDFLVVPTLTSRTAGLQTTAPVYFASASPGAANSEGLPGLAPAPVFSRRGGALTNELALELKVRSGKIHYTTDGTEPTESSPTYTEPVKLTGSTLVRARNYAEGQVPSLIKSESYTMLDESLFDFTSNLPLVILNSHGERITYGERTHAAAEFFDTVKGKSSLTGPLDYAGQVEMNIRGFSSLQYNKHSFTFRLKDESDSKPKVAVLGFPKDSDWVLYAPYPDKSLIRDVLAYELSAQMGHYAPRTKFVELFLHSRGDKLMRRDYLGVYVMVEKIKRSKHRVNIEELTPGDNSEPAITGGYIFKRDHSRRQSPNFYTERGTDYFFVEPNEREITRQQAAWLRRYMNQFEQSLYGANFKDPAKGYAAYLDVNSFIDQHWLIELSKNIDGFRYSVYLSKDRGGKLKLEPVWDWNLSFGNANYYEGWEPNGWYTPNLRDNEICWFNRLVQDPEFEQKYIDRWGELRRDVFSPERLLKRVDEMAAQLNEAQQRNFQRWPILGRRIHPNYYVGGSYGAEITWMKQWIQRRVAWIDSQFVTPPMFSLKPGAVAPGSKLSFQAAAGKIYYTLDGSDPRAPGGAVSPKATPGDKPVALNGEVKVFARARNGSKWSSPTIATYRAGGQ